MAKKIKILDEKNGIVFNAEYDKVGVDPKPKVVRKTKEGIVVEEKSMFQDVVLREGMTRKAWVDENNNEYDKKDLTAYLVEDFRNLKAGEEIQEKTLEKEFNIVTYEPDSNYLEKYIIKSYYEAFPSDEGHEKDIDRQNAFQTNLKSYYKLWKYLLDNKLVAKGQFNLSSKGFTPSYAYLRAVPNGSNTHGIIEIGIFTEQKIYNHMQEFNTQEIFKAKDKTINMI